MPEDPLTTVVSALHGLGHDLDGLCVAELLWLAARARGGSAEAAREEGAEAAGGDGAGTVDPRELLSTWGRSVYGYGSTGTGGDGVPARQVSVPRGTALPRAREIARALRPLRRPWAAGRRHQLDVAETVSGYARSGELLPAFRPAPERWFDLTVVLDRSPTMAVWDDTVDELLKVLATTGAFRTLRVREVDSWEARPRRRRAGSRTAPGRRLVLVVSDCAAGAGGEDGFWGRIQAWAGAAPTVLVNPLPPKIWRHTGLDLPAVKVTTPGAPGVANARLHFLAPPLMEDLFGLPGERRTGWTPLPVVGLTPRSLARWARTLMRGDPEGCEAVLVPEPGTVLHRPASPQPVAEAAQLVEAFLHRASAPAVRLAVLCSTYPRMHAGMLHLVRQELVPEASTADLAEVVVGGLVAVGEEGPAGGGPVLTFRDGVRERLAPRLGARDAVRTRDTVSRFITEHADAASRFPALVPDTDGDALIPAGDTPLAEVSPATLRTLGPVAERGADPGVERPYFFLSYAHTPRYIETDPDPDMWVQRLFRDLSSHVMALTDMPAGYPAGFMDRQLRVGEGWAQRLGEVLATCRTFVPLYSPRYFASTTCGKEWFAFAQRTAYHHARSASSAKEAIIPASWVPVPPHQMPRVARRLAFDHSDFGERYATDGLYGMIKLRAYAEEYERAVYQLARRIVHVADTANIAVGRPVDYQTAPSAFETLTASRAQSDLRIAVVAPTVHDLPQGRDAVYYGDSPDDWNPYYADSRRPLAHVATELAFHLNSQVNVSSFDEELSRVSGAAGTARNQPPLGPLILLVDRWALEVPALREGMAALDAANPAGTSLILAWNRHDRQSHASDAELAAGLQRTIPRLMSRTTENSAAAARGVLTLEDFGAVMPQVVAATSQDYLRHAEAYPPTGASSSQAPRPRLLGPMRALPPPPGASSPGEEEHEEP
ncbi:TIR-like protein FxsC [Streptomyces sp. NPDC005409]|uniref:TIR-like protein FxsC n=1 Tax=Streptomyces sp. NPDC005409 TaxID=3155342 RepID=UPI0034528BD6